jgi:hypothetical protein
MDDAERPPDDAVAGRVPRTDWYLRARRLLVVPAALFAGLVVTIAYAAHAEHESARDATWRPWAWGGVAALSVVFLSWCLFQVRRIGRGWRRRRAAAIAAPWRRHGYWSHEGEARFVALSGPVVIERLRSALAWTSLFALLAAAVLGATGHRVPAQAACFAGLLSLVVVAVTAWRGFANLRVRWPEFPARMGGPVRLTFGFRKRRSDLERLTLTLRCVVETPRCGGMLQPGVRCVYARTAERGDRVGQDGGEVEVTFDVPADAPGSDPFGAPAVFWELAVACEAPRFRYDGAFLVPIYPPLS